MRVGAQYFGDLQCAFSVWAPKAKSVSVVLQSGKSKQVKMQPEADGYWRVRTTAKPGTQYVYMLDGKKTFPDPASHFQPRGVHGPSEVVDHQAFDWQDKDWQAPLCEQLIIYEVHIGTFTPQGTLDAMIPRLKALKELGINALELMPVAACPGKRNWGYDGVYPYAVQDHYGGPAALKGLVNAAHGHGLAVVLDVVYNHLGPEGNYLGAFAPYFSDRYQVPWGRAINFDGPDSNGVREYFIENALHWFEHYHIDALRLDAVQAIFDQSAYPFLAELSDRVARFSRQSGKPLVLIAESDLNDNRVHTPVKRNGLGMNASWCDDLHHSLHALCTGEQNGYYRDFGSFQTLFSALRDGYARRGKYSEYRKRNYGSAQQALPGNRLVVFAQNHDQVGNRRLGERISRLVSSEAVRWMAGVVLLSPYIPLLFMGEEYGEQSPFLFFTNHGDQRLRKAVYQGRRKEFAAFGWQGPMPDPADVKTFVRSRLDWGLRSQGMHRKMLAYYRALIRIRKTVLDCKPGDQVSSIFKAYDREQVVTMRLRGLGGEVFCIIHCKATMQSWPQTLPPGLWELQLDSQDKAWGGTAKTALTLQAKGFHLAPYQILVYRRKDADHG